MGIGGEVGAGGATSQFTSPFFSARCACLMARPPDQIDRAARAPGVDHDADGVPVEQLAERPAGERFGADMADASPGGDAGEAGIGDQRHPIAPGNVLQGACHLIGLFHPRSHRADAGEDHDIAGDDPPLLDRGDRCFLTREHACGPLVAINTVGADHARIDRGCLDDGALRGEVATREGERPLQPGPSRLPGLEDDIVGIDAVEIDKQLPEPPPPFAPAPPLERLGHRPARDGSRRAVDQPKGLEVEHHLRHTSSEEHSHRRMVDRAIGENAHEARYEVIDLDPVVDGRQGNAGGVGEGGDVEEEIRRPTERGMDHHRVAQGSGRDDVARLRSG